MKLQYRTPYPLEQLKAAINFNDGVGKCTRGRSVAYFQQDCSFYFRARAGSFMNNVNIRNGTQAWT